jgi:polyisoprenoid-binding protein YceI
MKKLILLITLALFVGSAFSVDSKKVSKQTHIKFFSSTPAEDIEAHNYKSIATLDSETGELVFSVPMQSFDFDKRLMQKHFNQEKFLDTKAFPKAKLIAKIINLEAVNFEENGNYKVQITGDMTIRGVTQEFNGNGRINIKENGIDLDSKFMLTLADYGIAFEKGKPAKNIAKEVEVTVEAKF